MSHQQDQLQDSGALGDQYQDAASRRSSRSQRAPSDHQKSSGMSGSRSRDELSTGAHQIREGGERKARIIRLAESLDSFTSGHYHMILAEWFCHLASIAITTFLVQRSLRTQYWEDEGGWDSTWYFGALDQGEVMKAFQFLAKGHELLITLSMGFIVVRLAREQIISAAGIALGLLVSSHRIQSFETLLQGRFRDSFFMVETWRKFGSLMVGAAIVFAAVLVKLAGPSSAILMLPTLKWWPVDFLPGFPQIHTYIQAPSNEVCPLSLVDYNLSRWDSLDCESTHMSIWCPGSGWDTLNAWSWSQAHMGTPSNLTMPLSDGYYGRPLSAYPDDGPTVVAMTLHNAMSETLGFLWDLPKEAFNLTAWPEAWFAKRVLLEADTSAPIVATSCNFRLQSDMGTNDVLYFPRVDRDHRAIAVPEDLWKNSSSPEYPKFEWIDLSTQNNSNISIGALITLPIVLNGDEQNGEPLLSQRHQDWAFVPCISIAHWSPVSTLFDDGTSRHSISSNLTAEDAYYTTVFGEASTETVAIGSNWAELLNVPGRYVENFMGDPANLSSIEALLWRQVMATPSSNLDEPPLRSFARDWFYSNFDTYNFQSDRPDRLIEKHGLYIPESGSCRWPFAHCGLGVYICGHHSSWNKHSHRCPARH